MKCIAAELAGLVKGSFDGALAYNLVMAETRPRNTALGLARARFHEGLPRKAQELKASLALVSAAPGAAGPRDELRRRLHALYASAQVFHQDALAAEAKEALATLDGARRRRGPLTAKQLDALANLVDRIPELGAVEGRPSRASADDLPLVAARRSGPERQLEGDAQQGRAPVGALRAGAQGEPSAPPTAPASAEPPGRAALAPEQPPVHAPPTGEAAAGEPPASEAAASADATPPAATSAGMSEAVDASEASSHIAAGEQHGERARPRASGAGAAPAPTLEPLASVLVVAGQEVVKALEQLLSPDEFEVLGCEDAQQALALARARAPELVLVERDAALEPDTELVACLRRDPFTDYIPILVLFPPGSEPDQELVRGVGADDAVGLPLDSEEMLGKLVELQDYPPEHTGGLQQLQEATPDEVAERVAHEIRRGISSAIQSGRDESVALDDSTELLAATWSAIGRVRAYLAQHSGGRVRFRDVPRSGEPSLLALVEGHKPDAARTGPSLVGRRIVVADDDATVRWFFGGLLKEAGATVLEAGDGKQALELVRNQGVDVVISDILMPELDGFGLCRELKRDVLLSDIPIILLSWKEDFLQRMRELQAGASAYLRKESSGKLILERVRTVLRPKARVESELRSDAQVRGRIEGLGVATLLRTVGHARPDAHVAVRGEGARFDAELRGGHLVSLACTNDDGSSVNGEAALQRLIGLTSGRFAVIHANTPVQRMFERPLVASLWDAASKLGALLDVVSESRLDEIGGATLDEAAVSRLPPSAVVELSSLLEALRDGNAPRALIEQGTASARQLEAQLGYLARRGALVELADHDGKDLLVTAFEGEPSAEGQPASEGAAAASAQPPSAAGQRVGAQPAASPAQPSVDGVAAADEGRASQAPGGRPSVPSRVQHAVVLRPEAEAGTEPLEAATSEPAAGPRTGADTQEARAASAVGTSPQTPAVAGTAAREHAPASTTLRPGDAAPKRAGVPGAGEASGGPGAAAREAKPAAPDSSSDHTRDTGAPSGVAPAVRQRRVFAVVLALVLAGIAVVFAYQPWGGRSQSPAPTAEPQQQRAPEPARQPLPESEAREPAESHEPLPASYGVLQSSIDPRSEVQVAAGQGLLVVQAPEGQEPVRVRVGDRDLGTPPIGVALAAGKHRIVFRRGGNSSLRFLVIRPQKTRVVRVPDLL